MLQCWELIDIVDCLSCFRTCGVVIEERNVIHHICGWRDVIQQVEGFVSCGPMEDKGVNVEVCDLGSEWYPPQFGAWEPPPFE